VYPLPRRHVGGFLGRHVRWSLNGVGCRCRACKMARRLSQWAGAACAAAAAAAAAAGGSGGGGCAAGSCGEGRKGV